MTDDSELNKTHFSRAIQEGYVNKVPISLCDATETRLTAFFELIDEKILALGNVPGESDLSPND